jgi:hypothetical protein
VGALRACELGDLGKTANLDARPKSIRCGGTTGRNATSLAREAGLPAVAAIAAVSTAATITAAATAATASATTTASAAPISAIAATTAGSAATAAAGAFGLRTGFVHDKVPAPEILTVEGSDRAIRLFIVRNFNESETSGLARKTITNQTDCGGVDTDLTEPFLQLLFRCVERKIADVKLLHLGTPSARNLTHDCGAH